MKPHFQNHFLFIYRKWIFFCVCILTIIFLFLAKKVEKSYDYFATLPPNHIALKQFKHTQKIFNQHSSSIVLGIESNQLFNSFFFQALQNLHKKIASVDGVENVLSVANIVQLHKDNQTKKFIQNIIFDSLLLQQKILDSQSKTLKKICFYKDLIIHDSATIIVVNIENKVAASSQRDTIVKRIETHIAQFEQLTHCQVNISGLPYIRTKISQNISNEMQSLLILSSLFLLLCVLLVYRSWIFFFITIVIVGFGIIWSLGLIQLLGYKLTILTAIVPSIVVIVGVPNTIYFLNKYQSQIQKGNNNSEAIVQMLKSMGLTTFYCNLIMAIGFFVFMATKSQLLFEFGLVAGLNILLKFLLSYSLIPLLLYFLPTQKNNLKQKKQNQKITAFVYKFYDWLNQSKKGLLLGCLIVLFLSLVGILFIKSNTFITDDVPQNNRVVQDLLFFEKHFNGVLPLDIVLFNKKKNKIFFNHKMINQIDILSQQISQAPNISSPLSFIELIKFARQSFYDLDSSSFSLPTEFDFVFIEPYLKSSTTTLNNISSTLIDSSKQTIRLSCRVADIGSEKMKDLNKWIEQKITSTLDTNQVGFYITGAAQTFLEGNKFIMKGLYESVLWAVCLIAFCVFLMFRNWKIVLISIGINIFPLLISLAIMGWTKINIQPSTVIIFSIALGISIDITIRYLITFKHFFKRPQSIVEINRETLQETFQSIVFTSFVLFFGFLIFIFSHAKGIQALGWLTSITLLFSSIINLVFLPLLLNRFIKK